jgi:hypothetical protein
MTLFSPPLMIKPPIATLSPDWTRARVETFDSLFCGAGNMISCEGALSTPARSYAVTAKK